ncbi:MAG: hypothetical protein IJP74_00930 [Prevotella sp.]|nr:hypothetical protein [Prevotella sp.]
MAPCAGGAIHRNKQITIAVYRERVFYDDGFKKGQANEKTKNARKMKELGSPVEFISKVTGLTAEEIDRL